MVKVVKLRYDTCLTSVPFHLLLLFVLILLSALGGQDTEEGKLLGSEGLGHEEAGGDNSAPGPEYGEASGQVKRDGPAASHDQSRPCGLRRGGRHAAQHQAAQGHSDQALRER